MRLARLRTSATTSSALEFDSHMHDKVAALSQLDVNFLRVDLALNYMSKDGGTVMLVEFKQAGSIGTGNVKAELVKQARTYASASGSLHIALCNYESLVLLEFDDKFSIVEVTVVDKKVQTFRKALFGFFLYAIKYRNGLHR